MMNNGRTKTDFSNSRHDAENDSARVSVKDVWDNLEALYAQRFVRFCRKNILGYFLFFFMFHDPHRLYPEVRIKKYSGPKCDQFLVFFV